MPGPSDKVKREIATAFKNAADQAAFKMNVRHSLGGEMKFETFAEDLVVSAALDFVIDAAVRRLKRKGIKLTLGSPGPSRWDDLKPDRYTLMYDGKTIRAGVQWNF